MKKKIGLTLGIICVMFFSTIIAVSANEESSVVVFINGQEETIQPYIGKNFIDSQGRTQVPMRFISKYVGANINSDEKEQEFNINNVQKTVVLNIGDKNIKVNGKAVVMDAMPTVIKDVPYVPVRFITEGLGYTIEYKSISGKSCIFITIPM